MKTCTGCGIEKAAEYFSRNKKHSDGREYKCKACKAEYFLSNKERLAPARIAYVVSHRDAIQENKARYYRENADFFKEKARQRRAANLHLCLAREAKRRADNRDAFRAKSKKTYRKHRSKILAYAAEYRRTNHALIRAKSSAIQKRNRAHLNAYGARRRCERVNATPAWANAFFIEEAYGLARLRTKITGIRWDVDHIVPLKSPIVCGLHVERNLRVIPRRENQSKGNRHWPDMPQQNGGVS